MATDKSVAVGDGYAGMIVPDTRMELWAAESNYTQASPRPGIPVPQQATGMTLRTRGQQSASGSLDIRSQKGGFPQPKDGASYLWRTTGDTNWRGHDVPSVITHWESVVWTDGSGDYKHAKHPHAVTLSDQTVLCAYQDRDDAQANPYRVRVAIRSPSLGTWSHVTVESQSAAFPSDVYPCLCLLPSGRVQLYFWVFDPALVEAQVRMYYSDDDGATWSLGANACLDTAINYDTGAYDLYRIRVAYLLGTMLMVVSLDNTATTGISYPSTFHQYASRDDGNTFQFIHGWDTPDDKGGAYHDIVIVGGLFLFLFSDTDDQMTRLKRVGNAFQTLYSQADVPLGFVDNTANRDGANFITDGDGAMCVDDVGRTWVLVRTLGGSGNNECSLGRSSNGGVDWDRVGQSAALTNQSAWFRADANTYPTGFCVTPCQGRLLVLTNHLGDSAYDAGSITALFLGGPTTVTMPGYRRYPSDLNRVSWEVTWAPYDTPDNVGWTATGAGTGALTANADLQISTATSQKDYRQSGFAGTIAEGVIAEAHMSVETGGDLSDDRIALRVVIDGGAATADYDVSVRFSESAIRVFDNNGSAQLGSDFGTHPPSGGVRVKISIGEDVNGTAHFRLWVSAHDSLSDRQWTLAVDATPTDGGGGAGTDLLIWGHPTATGTNVSHWYFVAYSHDEWTGRQLYGFSNPDDLFGTPYSYRGSYVNDGVVLEAIDGPTILGDEWVIATRYDYEIGRCLYTAPTVSPRTAWRSTSTALQTLAFRCSTVGDSHLLNDVVGIGLFGTNATQVIVDFYDADTSSWVNSKTIAIADGLTGLRWDRQGNTLRPNTGASSTNEPYLYYNEAAGWAVEITASSSAVTRSVSQNTEGKWDDATTRRTSLVLSDAASGDDTTGTAGKLIPKDCVILVHLLGNRYSGVRLRISAPSAGTIPAPVESYWKIGTLILGPVIVHPEHYSFGSTVETRPNTELLTARDGTNRAKVYGPPARVVEYAWTDMQDMNNALSRDGAPSPNYITANANASAEPVAGTNDTGYQLEGAVRFLQGPKLPVVYLPYIARLADGTTTQVLNRRHEAILVRLTRPVRIENVREYELHNMIARIAPIEGEEIV